MVGGGKTDVRSRIAHAGNHTLFGKGTWGRGIAALRRLGGAFHFLRGGGERLLAMPPANSTLSGALVDAPLVATTFPIRAMPPTNSSLLGIVGAPIVATLFHLRAMPPTNSTPNGIVGASLVAAAVAFRLRAMPHTNSALNGSIGASLMAAAKAFHFPA